MKLREYGQKVKTIFLPEDKKLRNKRIAVLAGGALLVLTAVLIAWFYGKPLLAFVLDTERFRAWMNGHGAAGPLAFIAIRTVQTVVKIIPAEPLEVGSGYAFGTFYGMALCMIGTLIGSFIIIGFTKVFGMRMVEVFVPREKIESFRFLQDTKRMNILMFVIFLIPGTPKDLITYFVGVTKMKPSVFLAITTVARIPSIITSTICGAALGARNIWLAVVVYVLTVAFSGLGLLVYRKISAGAQPGEPTGMAQEKAA